MLQHFRLETRLRDEMIDITREVRRIVASQNVRNGTAVVYSPHTTAGIAINENADPDVKRDILMRLNEIFPWEHPAYRHMEGNSAAHLKAVMTGTSQTVFIEKGEPVLGTWQGIYFCEFDGPRTRTCYVKVMEG